MTTAEYHSFLPSPFRRVAVHHYVGYAFDEVTHSHDSFQFTYILEGEADFAVNGVRHSLEAGQLALLRPGVMHHFHTASYTITRAYNCYGGMARREQLGPLADFLAPWIKNQFLIAKLATGDIEALVNRLLESKTAPETSRYATEYALNLQILIAFCNAILAEHPFPLVPDIPPSIVKSLHFLEKNYTSPLSLDKLSEISALSPSRFSALFSETIGCPPMQYVHRQRINKAKDLLTFSNLTLSQIALQAGFASPSYFCRTFKAATGFSPAAFRRRQAQTT